MIGTYQSTLQSIVESMQAEREVLAEAEPGETSERSEQRVLAYTRNVAVEKLALQLQDNRIQGDERDSLFHALRSTLSSYMLATSGIGSITALRYVRITELRQRRGR